MPTSLTKRILRFIENWQNGRQTMISAGDRVGVAVSGGADSVALLRLFLELRAEMGISLVVLHFNHQLRGAESDADEEFVARLAAEHGIELLSGREDVAGVARAKGWNLEDAARRLRYGFFASAMKTGRAMCVAVAHTADDQAETVLARLVRGTGPAGLGAIYPVKAIDAGSIVRPLLEIRRAELRAYLKALGQEWREDRSNLDTTRLRARLRHQVLPVLERSLQPAIVEHLCRLADMARRDEAFWSALVADRLGALVRREGGRRGIRAADLLAPMGAAGGEMDAAAQIALAARLVRAIVADLRGEHAKTKGQLTAQHVEQVLHLAAEGSSGQRREIPRAVAERSFDWIWFMAAGAADGTSKVPRTSNQEAEVGCRSDGARAFSHRVQLRKAAQSAVIVVPEIERRFRLKVIDWPAPGVETRNEDVLDRDLLRSPLVLRSWRPGDAFRPRGRRHAHKMKQFLRENRVAVRDRAGWPVLTSGGEVIWARGLPVAAEFAAGKGTRAGVVIAEEKW